MHDGGARLGLQGRARSSRNVQLPIGHEVVFIAETLAAMQTETGKGHPSGILPEDDAARMRNPKFYGLENRSHQLFVERL